MSIAPAASVFRVVADSNIYISAFNFGGAADEVLAIGRAGRMQLYVSPVILQEIRGVLRRKFHWSPARLRDALDAIQSFTFVVQPRERIRVLAEDPADNRILECAAAVEAHFVVTGDKHLQRLGKFRSTAIVSPRQFLTILSEVQPSTSAK